MKSARLKDLGNFRSGLTYSPENLCNEGEGLLVLRSSNIQNGKLSLMDNVYVNCSIPSSMYVRKGDIIICSRNGSANLVGKTALINERIPATWGAFMMLFRTRYNPEYMNYLLNASISKHKGMFGTSTINQLTNHMLGNIFVNYVTDTIRQAHIANIIKENITKIDNKIGFLTSKIDKLENLKASLIHNVVINGLDSTVETRYSGVDWIGNIPSHWEIKRIKQLFIECKSTSTSGQESLLSVSEYYGVAKRSDKMAEDELFETRADSLIGYKICHPGDLVINIMLAWKTGLGISEYYGIVSPAYAVYKGKGIVPRFYHYLLRTNLYTAQFKRSSKGIIDSRLRMYTDRFNNILAIVPPIDEQKAIADYLDEKCSKIDKAIELTEKQIRKYKDLKIALVDKLINTPEQCD